MTTRDDERDRQMPRAGRLARYQAAAKKSTLHLALVIVR
jgi:hypothetical protein